MPVDQRFDRSRESCTQLISSISLGLQRLNRKRISVGRGRHVSLGTQPRSRRRVLCRIAAAPPLSAAAAATSSSFTRCGFQSQQSRSLPSYGDYVALVPPRRAAWRDCFCARPLVPLCPFRLSLYPSPHSPIALFIILKSSRSPSGLGSHGVRGRFCRWRSAPPGVRPHPLVDGRRRRHPPRPPAPGLATPQRPSLPPLPLGRSAATTPNGARRQRPVNAVGCGRGGRPNSVTTAAGR